jgi:hypothetical protein
MLLGIQTNTTYENTLQALEDRFGDQQFAAAYRCQLTTRIQNPREPLQDFATAIEMLAHRAYPNLPADYVAREAGKALTYGIRDADIKIQLLLGGEKMVNEALRQALELQALLVAVRPYKNNAKTYLITDRSPPNEETHNNQDVGTAESRGTLRVIANMAEEMEIAPGPKRRATEKQLRIAGETRVATR